MLRQKLCICRQGFKEKFNKFLYYHWVQISIIPQVVKNASRISLHKFEHAQVHHNFKFTFRTCTTTNMNEFRVERFFRFLKISFIY